MGSAAKILNPTGHVWQEDGRKVYWQSCATSSVQEVLERICQRDYDGAERLSLYISIADFEILKGHAYSRRFQTSNGGVGVC